jgi:membrane-bound lytic murein transglycosylase D
MSPIRLNFLRSEKFIALLILTTLTVSGCVRRTTVEEAIAPIPPAGAGVAELRQTSAANPEILADLVTQVPTLRFPEVVTPDEPAVNAFVARYGTVQKRCLATSLERRRKYLPIIDKVFREHGLPEDVMHVALVESAFQTGARSHRGAVGLWQFISSTAKRYGLVVGKDKDERRDVQKSTEAAARHLTQLYVMFRDWPLAFAAYNAGEGTVLRAIKLSGTRDFFKLARQGHFKKETREFVSRILALTVVLRSVRPYEGLSDEDIMLAKNDR